MVRKQIVLHAALGIAVALLLLGNFMSNWFLLAYFLCGVAIVYATPPKSRKMKYLLSLRVLVNACINGLFWIANILAACVMSWLSEYRHLTLTGFLARLDEGSSKVHEKVDDYHAWLENGGKSQVNFHKSDD
jgi:hypothetical protein